MVGFGSVGFVSFVVSWFFLSYSPISICCFVGIWEWRTWALCVFLPLHLASVWALHEDSWWWNSWACYSWVLDPRRLSGRLCGIGPFVVKAFVASWDLCGQDLLWSFGSPQFGCGCVPQGCCTGLFSAPKEFIVEGGLGPLWSSSSEKKVRPLWRWANLLWLLTPLQRDVHLLWWNSGIHPRLRVPRLSLYPSSLLMHFTLW